jgi:RNA polymerase sigma-70 factor (ECF subfamily)
MRNFLAPAQLQRLHLAYADGLFRYFWAATGQIPDAEDLVQEFFVKLAKTGFDLESLRQEKAWIFTIARNLTLDWHRSNARRPRSTSQCHDFLTFPLEPAANPDAAFLGREMIAALDELPAEQRLVVQMRLWEGFTLREIAENQDIPLQTAASRLRYAVDRLRQRLRHLYKEIQ